MCNCTYMYKHIYSTYEWNVQGSRNLFEGLLFGGLINQVYQHVLEIVRNSTNADLKVTQYIKQKCRDNTLSL